MPHHPSHTRTSKITRATLKFFDQLNVDPFRFWGVRDVFYGRRGTILYKKDVAVGDNPNQVMVNDVAVKDLIFDVPAVVTQKYSFRWYRNSSHTHYPLMQAVSLGASLETVKRIYEACPDAIREKGYRGWTPLHCACRFRALVEVVQFLIEVHPAAVKEIDDFGLSPLEMACSFENPRLDVVSLLAERFPDAIERKDDHNSTLLHLFLMKPRIHARLEVVKILLRYQTNTLRVKNSSGRTPLHAACLMHTPFDVVWFLAERYPEALQEEDKDGCIPLHLVKGQAADNGFPSSNIFSWVAGAEPHNPLLQHLWPCDPSTQDNTSVSETRTLLRTLNNILCLRPNNEQITKMLVESSGMTWRGLVLPMLDYHPEIVHRVNTRIEVMPALLERVGREGRVQTMFQIVRQSVDIFKVTQPEPRGTKRQSEHFS